MMTEEEFDQKYGWLIANYSYGHLDEIPDNFLDAAIRDEEACMAFTTVLYQASKTKTDNIEEMFKRRNISVKGLRRIYGRVRYWLLVLKLQRLGQLKIVNDILIKELVSANSQITTPDGKPLNCEIVEVSCGQVSFVGKEINLCQK